MTADPYILAAHQALADEVGILDILAHADIHPIARSRRLRVIAAELRADADLIEGLADRICQALN